MAYVLRNSMEKIEFTIRYTKLFNIYGNLLPDSQRNILNDYFFMDLSITEISENRKISRAAVEDALRKGIKKLEYYEGRLNILKKKEAALNEANRLNELIQSQIDLGILISILEDF